MNRITNKQLMEKLETIQNDNSHKELIKKIDATLHTVQNIQNSIADKETIRMLSYQTKKSSIVIYAGLSLAYLGIGLALLLASFELIAVQYSIIFGVFFGGSIVLASLAYIQKKEMH